MRETGQTRLTAIRSRNHSRIPLLNLVRELWTDPEEILVRRETQRQVIEHHEDGPLPLSGDEWLWIVRVMHWQAIAVEPFISLGNAGRHPIVK